MISVTRTLHVLFKPTCRRFNHSFRRNVQFPKVARRKAFQSRRELGEKDTTYLPETLAETYSGEVNVALLHAASLESDILKGGDVDVLAMVLMRRNILEETKTILGHLEQCRVWLEEVQAEVASATEAANITLNF